MDNKLDPLSRAGSFSRAAAGNRTYKFPIPETIRQMGKSLCATISEIILVDKRCIWLVNGCLEYHRPIITDACPPKQSQKSLHPKLVTILPRVSWSRELINRETRNWPGVLTNTFYFFCRNHSMSDVSNLMMWSRHLFLTKNEWAIRYVESTIIDNVSEKPQLKGLCTRISLFLVNSVLKSFFSAFTGSQNAPVVLWRRYQTGQISSGSTNHDNLMLIFAGIAF